MHISTFVYKWAASQLPEIFSQYYITRGSITERNTRQAYVLDAPFYGTDRGQRSIKYLGAKIWNVIPNFIKDAPTVHLFKKKCKDYLLDNDLTYE